MIKEIGNGKLKILVISSNEENIFEEMGASLTNLQFTLTSNSNIENLDQFIFALDLSNDDNQIKGYGDRYLGIIRKSNPDLGNEIKETNSPFAKEFAKNYEFSTLEIGSQVVNRENIIRNIFVYLNGRN